MTRIKRCEEIKEAKIKVCLNLIYKALASRPVPIQFANFKLLNASSHIVPVPNTVGVNRGQVD